METRNGLLSGLTATVAVSLIMVTRGAADLMPHINTIQAMTKINGIYFGLPLMTWIAWLEHFFIGTVLWGLLFAGTWKRLPGSSFAVKGVLFSIAAWLLMMLLMMPMAGAGFFGLRLGIAAPVMTLMLHLLYGGVLGSVFGALHSRQQRTNHKNAHA